MPIATKYLFIVSMDVTKEMEALFNEVYDTEHVPLLMKVPGVKAVSRMKTEPAAFNLAGERKLLDGGSEPNTWRSTRSTAPTCCSARNGPRRRRKAAGPARYVPSPRTAGTSCAR